MEPAETKQLPTASHFTILVYAFQHNFSGVGRVESFRALAGRWRHWWSRLDDKALAISLDDVHFFLPHVQRVLFPEVAPATPIDPADRLAAARRLSGLSLDELADRIPPDSMLRITYDPGRLAPMRRFEVQFSRKSATASEEFGAPVLIDWIDAILFPQQVGLLLLKVRLDETGPSVSRINDLNYYLRQVHAPKLDWQLADWRMSGVSDADSCKARNVIDYLLQGLTAEADPRSPSLAAALARLARAGEGVRPTATPFANVYGQLFHVYHYGCLSGPKRPDQPSGPFESSAERALYELATCTDTQSPDYLPDPTYLRDLMTRHGISLWDIWKGLALNDGVAFLSLAERTFTSRDLPHNIESDYFYLYVLSIFHKIRLSLMAAEMLGRGDQLGDRVRRARLLWDEFLTFQDDYWFGEVTHRPQGIAIYKRFREGMGIGPLYDEIRGKVREYQEFHELKVERQVGDLLAILTFLGVPAGALCSLFGSALVKNASWPQFFIALVVGWAILGSAWLVWTHRDEIRDEAREPLGNGRDAPPR